MICEHIFAAAAAAADDYDEIDDDGSLMCNIRSRNHKCFFNVMVVSVVSMMLEVTALTLS